MYVGVEDGEHTIRPSPKRDLYGCFSDILQRVTNRDEHIPSVMRSIVTMIPGPRSRARRECPKLDRCDISMSLASDEAY